MALIPKLWFKVFYWIFEEIHRLPEWLRVWWGDHSLQQLSTPTSPRPHFQKHTALIGIRISCLSEKKQKQNKICSFLWVMKPKTDYRTKLECGPPYPVSRRCSRDVRVYIQITLQTQMDIFRNTQKIKQRQQEALKEEHSPWLPLHCCYQTWVCDTDPRCLCSSGPWSQRSTNRTVSTNWNLYRSCNMECVESYPM